MITMALRKRKFLFSRRKRPRRKSGDEAEENKLAEGTSPKILRMLVSSSLLLLLLITLLAAFLRFYRLTEIPPSLFGDEVDVGYQAYSILKTGRDYAGNFLPIHFQSLADWRTPLFLYGTVPFIWLFGLTELGVRFQPALLGLLTIPLFYFLVKELFESLHSGRVPPAGGPLTGVSLALLASLLLAISPWHLQYSRAAFEVTQMLFLILFGLLFFLKGLKKGKWLSLAALCFALAPYSYNTAKLFIPLFIGWLVFCFWSQLKKISGKHLLMPLLVFGLISLPMVVDVLWGEGADRFSILSIFSDPTVAPQVGFERLVDAQVKLKEVPVGFSPALSSRFFHNKFLSWGMAFLINYFRVFSTEFLFIAGDINLRHSIQGGFGQLFWLDALFLPLGIYWLLAKGKKSKLKFFLLGWILFSPIPSVLTRDGGNHATRLILMLPPLLILISLGMVSFLTWFKSRGQKIAASFLLIALYSLLFSLYSHRYYVHWPHESERWWHPGFKEAAAFIKENEVQYDYVIWSDRDQPPLIFFLFWSGFDPSQFHQSQLAWEKLSDAIEADHLTGTKYYLGHISEERIRAGGFVGTLKPNMLYVAPESEIGKNLRLTPVPSSVKLLKVIDLPSGGPTKYVLTGI